MKKKIDRILENYPGNVFKNRKDHIIVKRSDSPEPQVIAANTRVIPGIMTQRGCC